MSDTATMEVSGEIKTLGDKLAGLTLKQAVELKDYLKSAYGIEPAAGGAVMMAAGPAGVDCRHTLPRVQAGCLPSPDCVIAIPSGWVESGQQPLHQGVGYSWNTIQLGGVAKWPGAVAK